jgi:Ca-activated chloride channel homolog
MVKQIASNSANDRRSSIIDSPSRRSVFRWMLLAAFLFAVIPPVSKAESLASKNKEGNRLFAQGRFEDAEKAYLEAQGKSPGKPEILYNLGNSLIKQKKYEQGVQSLRQSLDKGNPGVKENSWYNTGNALFSMGKFKESAESYVQALKLNPSDQDAKHNLELALMKLKEQESKPQNRNSQKNQDASSQDSSGNNKEGQQQAGKDGQKSVDASKQQNEPKQQPSIPNAPREGSIGRDHALQILDALQNRELEEQRKLWERRATQRGNKKDW